MDPLDKVWAEFANKADKQNGKEKDQQGVKALSIAKYANFVKISYCCIHG